MLALLSHSHHSLDVCLVCDAALLGRSGQVLDLFDVRAQRLGGVVEGEAEENSPEVVRRERLKDGREGMKVRKMSVMGKLLVLL